MYARRVPLQNYIPPESPLHIQSNTHERIHLPTLTLLQKLRTSPRCWGREKQGRLWWKRFPSHRFICSSLLLAPYPPEELCSIAQFTKIDIHIFKEHASESDTLRSNGQWHEWSGPVSHSHYVSWIPVDFTQNPHSAVKKKRHREEIHLSAKVPVISDTNQ